MRAEPLSAVRAALARAGAGPESCAWRVPGRIEVLGKHTDYAGGRSLICAVDQGFVVAAAPRSDALVRVLNVADGTEVRLALDPDLPPPPEPWMRYPATVVRRIARNFPDARQGVDLAFLSDLPQASGMSSSSAFMVAVFLAIADGNRLSEDAGLPAGHLDAGGPGRLPGHRRERPELRRVDRGPRHGDVRRKRRSHGDVVLPGWRAESILVLPGAARASGGSSARLPVRRGGERRQGGKDRRG